MTFQEIEFALKVNGVEDADTQTLINYCRTKGTDYQKLDELLLQMGYDKVFTDEFFGWNDSEDDYIDDEEDEYFSTKRMYHRHYDEDDE